jgi:hypothetical protein
LLLTKFQTVAASVRGMNEALNQARVTDDGARATLDEWERDRPIVRERLTAMLREKEELQRAIIRCGASNIAGVLNALALKTGVFRMGLPHEGVEGLYRARSGTDRLIPNFCVL